MRPGHVARERRQTLYFLAGIHRFSPVFLDTEVDMTRIAADRAEAKRRGQRFSTVSYVLHTAAPVLERHPQANAAVAGRWRLRLAEYPDVSAKLALDKTVGGRRVVLAAVLRDLQTASLEAIQERVDYYRDADADVAPEFAAVRALHRIPEPVGRLLAALATRPLRRRPERMGTFAVSSLGASAVDSFHSVGGTTITLGLGRVLDRPVVRDRKLAVAPVMRLSLAFDHRVLDGAEAAGILTEIKEALEAYSRPIGPGASAQRPLAQEATR